MPASSELLELPFSSLVVNLLTESPSAPVIRIIPMTYASAMSSAISARRCTAAFLRLFFPSATRSCAAVYSANSAAGRQRASITRTGRRTVIALAELVLLADEAAVRVRPARRGVGRLHERERDVVVGRARGGAQARALLARGGDGRERGDGRLWWGGQGAFL
jgi:hypothetical protein